ncbi:MAG: hypothetical protein VB092_00720, partial [Oscillospiraceae bacterium]|nr:hypothetical protein [Oscillospiraceae bacterium]
FIQDAAKYATVAAADGMENGGGGVAGLGAQMAIGAQIAQQMTGAQTPAQQTAAQPAAGERFCPKCRRMVTGKFCPDCGTQTV